MWQDRSWSSRRHARVLHVWGSPWTIQESPFMRMFRQALLSLLACVALPGAAFAYDASAMVVSTKGSLPLILTVPHDGAEPLDALPARTKGTVVRDAGTRELAERVATLLEARLGKRPYIVVARFSRKYLDANRPEQEAMESQDALPAYRAYHDQITAYIAEIKTKFPAGALMVDVHGQSGDPDTTFRGTRAGLTAKTLLGRFGQPALQGEKSITGVLASKGYPVHPAVGAESLREDPRYAGGHTVATYGSHQPQGIDAIQLEFGRNHRANTRLAEDLADALVVFMTEYDLLRK
ncbi:MAG: N-formylglutamate amidohydrolase [Polaromonas sp.]|nr:N-formylglutamate amidohydrolase [Polaromonas sp.]MDP3753584.1 N-formylglutamate amidohydrolase [Polaromonas sp.]